MKRAMFLRRLAIAPVAVVVPGVLAAGAEEAPASPPDQVEDERVVRPVGWHWAWLADRVPRSATELWDAHYVGQVRVDNITYEHAAGQSRTLLTGVVRGEMRMPVPHVLILRRDLDSYALQGPMLSVTTSDFNALGMNRGERHLAWQSASVPLERFELGAFDAGVLEASGDKRWDLRHTNSVDYDRARTLESLERIRSGWQAPGADAPLSAWHA